MNSPSATSCHASLQSFHPVVQRWFAEAFPQPTPVQAQAWPVLAAGNSALLLAPTGSGKTLAAFLSAIDQIVFGAGSESRTQQTRLRQQDLRSAGCGSVGDRPQQGSETGAPRKSHAPREGSETGASREGSESGAPREGRAPRKTRARGVETPGVRVVYVSPLKALGVDVERNLRSPIAGVRAVAQREAIEHHEPQIGVRTGDTPSAERAQLLRSPPDILITTPESLYLMLTSKARDILRDVETVIVDEIHSVAATKRGAHLFVTLERLEHLRRSTDPQQPRLQRIGLSATQRPLDEIARLLGGAEATADPHQAVEPRPVEIIQAGEGKQLDIRIEVPLEDMARLGQMEYQTGPAAAGPSLPSIWPAIHPRLVELIRSHRSTMIFVNSRRLAERLASAINELAEEELALAHHGSIAKESRLRIEDRLKRGTLPAIVATSSLELGIDMGAVDLVVQIEAPPSIASGIQRIGRAGHHVGAPSSGVLFPKYRGDLVACAAASQPMMLGRVEETRYPRNPLDVLAQQLVATVAMEPATVDQLYALVRGAAPFAELPRSSFEGVLDLLSGRYPSDAFAELKPRVTWDRIEGTVTGRKSAQRIAVLNAGTIPDRGLYGVFLADGTGSISRVGELDEEMVFETYPGDVFLLGASSWRVMEITQDRVLVTPAPGEPGRMPFWRGDGPGRPLAFGLEIGRLIRRLVQLEPHRATEELTARHGLDQRAATNLLNYLQDQIAATGEVPTDKTILVECFLDEIGDWRVVVMSPFGARVHAPWATAISSRLQAETAGEVDMTWTDDGMVFRLPESDRPPPLASFFPTADEIDEIVIGELAGTALFAARFRENAARSLLLPRRTPGRRTPLWMQRRKAADLLQVASQYRQFPVLLETYRECLRDVFDLPGLKQILRDVQRRAIRVEQVETPTASPFAGSLMFSYTANFLYNGDAPLAERRAQTLALDHAQLRELLGDAELRELLDGETIDQLALELQRLVPQRHARHRDAVHELLLELGDLTRDELRGRVAAEAADDSQLQQWIAGLIADRRVIEVRVGGQLRLAAAEDAARLRDALGIVPPPGLPHAFLENVADPLGDLVSRFARTHVPFRVEDIAARYELAVPAVREALARLAEENRVLEGEFLPGGHGREWCDAQVLRIIKRRSLARLREQVEPVAPDVLARFLAHWQGTEQPRRGLDGLLDVVEQLQGMPLPATALEDDILPARVTEYQAADLDELCAAGEIVWRGFDPLGPADGRIALYLTDHVRLLAPPVDEVDDPLAGPILQLLEQRGALFFDDLLHSIGGFRNDLLNALWQLVWAGAVTNDTLAPLRSLCQAASGKERGGRRRTRNKFRSRRQLRPPGSEGRWSLLSSPDPTAATPTECRQALATQLLQRYGVVTRSAVQSEAIAGGFAGLYPVFKAMEEAARARRGYFIEGLGAAQFAAPGAEDQLRNLPQLEEADERPAARVLAATDPANPFGALLSWPERQDDSRPQRAAGARVLLWQGNLVGYLNKTANQLLTYLPDAEPARQQATGALVRSLAAMAGAQRAVFLTHVDGQPAGQSPLAEPLIEAGFVPASRGLLRRRQRGNATAPSLG